MRKRYKKNLWILLGILVFFGLIVAFGLSQTFFINPGSVSNVIVSEEIDGIVFDVSYGPGNPALPALFVEYDYDWAVVIPSPTITSVYYDNGNSALLSREKIGKLQLGKRFSANGNVIGSGNYIIKLYNSSCIAYEGRILNEGTQIFLACSWAGTIRCNKDVNSYTKTEPCPSDNIGLSSGNTRVKIFYDGYSENIIETLQVENPGLTITNPALDNKIISQTSPSDLFTEQQSQTQSSSNYNPSVPGEIPLTTTSGQNIEEKKVSKPFVYGGLFVVGILIITIISIIIRRNR